MFCLPQRPFAGFSLLEALVVLALVGVLAGLASPGFASLRRNAVLTSTADQLLGALYFAQSAAARRGIPVSVCLSADQQRCSATPGVGASGWLLFFDNDRESPVQISPADERLSTVRLPPGLAIQGTRAAVTFWPAARAGTTATFAICDSRDLSVSRAVVLSQTGRPRVTSDSSAVCQS